MNFIVAIWKLMQMKLKIEDCILGISLFVVGRGLVLGLNIADSLILLGSFGFFAYNLYFSKKIELEQAKATHLSQSKSEKVDLLEQRLSGLESKIALLNTFRK